MSAFGCVLPRCVIRGDYPNRNAPQLHERCDPDLPRSSEGAVNFARLSGNQCPGGTTRVHLNNFCPKPL